MSSGYGAKKVTPVERRLAWGIVATENELKQTQINCDGLLQVMRDIQREAQTTLDKQSPVANGFCLVKIEAMARMAIKRVEGEDQ